MVREGLRNVLVVCGDARVLLHSRVVRAGSLAGIYVRFPQVCLAHLAWACARACSLSGSVVSPLSAAQMCALSLHAV